MDLIPPQPPKSQFPHHHFTILLAVAVSSIFFTIWAAAGTLTPSGAPGGTMKTLQEIYDSIAGTTFDSSSVPADQNGSLIEGLKYISDNLSWASSSNNVYNLNDGGNVGIGTTNPVGRLTVYSSSGFEFTPVPVVVRNGTYTSYSAIDFFDYLGNDVMGIGYANPGSSYLAGRPYVNAQGSLTLSTFATPRLVIETNGNVGIGTGTNTNLVSKLTVQARSGTSDILTIASSSGSEYLSMDFNGHTQITGSAINPIFMAETRGPTPGTSLDTANGVFIQGKYAYIINFSRDSLAIVDVSNPASPSFVSEFRPGGGAAGAVMDGPGGITVSGRYAYIAQFERDGLLIIDISNPSNPFIVGETRGTSAADFTGPMDQAQRVVVSGKYAYVTATRHGTNGTLSVIDISNPASPSYITQTRSSNLDSATGLAVVGNYAYVANSTSDSLAVINISNPASPSYMAKTQASGLNQQLNGATSVVVSGRYAYVTANARDSLAVVDISNPASPSFVRETRGPVPGTSLDGPNGLVISGQYAFVAANVRDGLVVVDISNPASPSYVAETRGATPGTTFDGINSLFASGRYIYSTNGARDSLAAVDIGSLTAPQIEAGTIRSENLSVLGYANFNNNILLKGGLVAGEGILANGGLSVSAASSSFMGRVGIGTTNPGLLAHIRSSVDTDILRLQDSDGTCDHNPEAGMEVVTCSSDQSLKENIVDAPSSLESLTKFRIREFNVISSHDRMVGVIAQEVLQTHPDLVSSTSSGILRVQQPSIWEVIKGLQEVASRTVTMEEIMMNNGVPAPGEGLVSMVIGSLKSAILEVKELVVEKFRAQTVRTEQLELIDENGSVNCVRIINNSLQSQVGECTVQ